MHKTNIEIAAIQQTNLNEKSTLKIPQGYYIIQENRPKERGKDRWVSFIIKDTILFQELEHKASEKHLEVQTKELPAGGNNIKLVDT